MLPGEKKYPHIFSPIKIGNLWAKNRIKYASTETNYNYSDGYVSEKELAYIEAHARGGSGIVTTQGAYTDPRGEGQGYVGMMGIWDDKFIPGLKKMADIIHQYDAAISIEISHGGSRSSSEINCGTPPMGPSSCFNFNGENAIEMDEEMMKNEEMKNNMEQMKENMKMMMENMQKTMENMQRMSKKMEEMPKKKDEK